MRSQRLGLLIGSVFGLVFVEVNSGALPTAVGVVVRVVGGLAFLLVLIGIGRLRPIPISARPAHAAGIGFGRGYWLVVAGEVVAIVAGARLLSGPLDAPRAGVAWVAFVVGAHFVGLAVVWAEPIFGRLGGSIAVCGVVGLVLGLTDASNAAVAAAGGVLPGALLLGFALWAVLPSARGGSGSSGPESGWSAAGPAVGVSE
jgi:hypothetical protein